MSLPALSKSLAKSHYHHSSTTTQPFANLSIRNCYPRRVDEDDIRNNKLNWWLVRNLYRRRKVEIFGRLKVDSGGGVERQPDRAKAAGRPCRTGIMAGVGLYS